MGNRKLSNGKDGRSEIDGLCLPHREGRLPLQPLHLQELQLLISDRAASPSGAAHPPNHLPQTSAVPVEDSRKSEVVWDMLAIIPVSLQRFS